MSSQSLPPGWIIVGSVSPDEMYEDPAQPSDRKRIRLFGVREDADFLLFDIPANTPASEVVRFFRVGEGGAMNSDFDSERLVERVASLADQISKIVPARPFFADTAGLKLKFLRKVTKDDLAVMEALFPEDEMFDLGLERYVSEWDGESRILEPVLADGFFHFWWD